MPRRPLLLHLDKDELISLTAFMKRCLNEGKLRARQRGNAIYLSHQGIQIPQIAKSLGHSSLTIYRWLKRYQSKGIAGLAEPLKRIKLSDERIRELIRVSHRSANPKNKQERRDFLNRWSFRQMADWAYDKWQIKLSPERVRQLVRKKMRE
jgi:transposase